MLLIVRDVHMYVQIQGTLAYNEEKKKTVVSVVIVVIIITIVVVFIIIHLSFSLCMTAGSAYNYYNSHQHQKIHDIPIWRHLRKDTVFSCDLCCRLIFLHGCSRTYRVASLRAGPVGRISYNLNFDCKHVRSVTCDLMNEYNKESISETQTQIVASDLSNSCLHALSLSQLSLN